MVIDDGWQSLHNMEPGYNGGPWREGNGKFPDMAPWPRRSPSGGRGPASGSACCGTVTPRSRRAGARSGTREYLDPTVPEVLSYIQEDLRTLRPLGL